MTMDLGLIIATLVWAIFALSYIRHNVLDSFGRALRGAFMGA